MPTKSVLPTEVEVRRVVSLPGPSEAGMPIRMRPRRAHMDVFTGPHAERCQRQFKTDPL